MTIVLDIVGSIVLYLSCTLASAAGIGGGGLSVLLVIFNFGFRKGVLLSLWSVLGNVLAQVLLALKAHHPLDKCRTLVYWDLVFVLLPAKLFGATIGVLVSSSAPDDALAIVAIFVLAFIVYGMYRKYTLAVQFESIASAACDARDIPVNSQSDSINLTRMLLSINANVPDMENSSAQRTESVTDVGVKETYLPSYPVSIIGATCATWAGYVVAFVILTFIRKCSAPYVVITSVFYPILFVRMFFRMRFLARRQKEGEENATAVMLDGDLNWEKVGRAMPVISVAVGALSSLVGVDSGEVISPMLLQMGLLPQVASATTGMLSVFVTTASIIEYAVRYHFQYILNFDALWFFTIGVLGGLSGKKIMKMKKFPSSVMILALILVLVLDALLFIIYLSTKAPDYSVDNFCS